MNEPLSDALLVLAVGMITVFVILSLVVLSGNLLIKVVNRFFPENEPITISKSKVQNSQNEISSSKMAAIVAAVDVITQGRGKISKIEKKS